MNTLIFRTTPSQFRGQPLAIPAPLRSGWQGLGTAPATAVALERQDQDGVLVVEAPGLDPAADLDVSVRGDVLTVSGTRRSSSGPVRRESSFSRSVTLPEGVGAEAVRAQYVAGVLRVRVSGMFPAAVEPETVSIAIASDVAPGVEATNEDAQPSA